MRSWSTMVRLLVILSVAVCTAGAARAQCVEGWRLGPASTFPGVDGSVHAFTVHDDGRGPAIYIGGEFEAAGGVAAKNIARWDGVRWEALGEGVNRRVLALASYQGELIVGGEFYQPGSAINGAIRRYGPVGWLQMKEGLSGTVNALVVHGGLLYVGGSFSAPTGAFSRNFLGWNGSDWVRVVGGLSPPNITALTVYNGEVIAAGRGSFDGLVGGQGVSRHVATGWRSMGGGTNGTVNALTVYNGELIAGGDIQTIGGSAINSVARWDGVSWKAFGAGLASHDVRSLATFGGQLFVGSDRRLFRWDGSAWRTEIGYLEAQGFLHYEGIFAMIPTTDRLIIGGGFSFIEESATAVKRLWGYSMAGWRDEKFEQVTGGLQYSALQLYPDGADVLAVGEFTMGGWGGVARLVEDEPARWERLAGDFSQTTRAVIRHEGRLVVGGDFGRVDGETVNRIARQKTTGGWEPMGLGFSGSSSVNEVRALADYRGDLIAAGSFTLTGSTPINRIARWDGTTWQALGGGLNGSVYVMRVYGDELVVAGNFTAAGGAPAQHIAAWNGATWRALGSGMTPLVVSLTEFDGALIAGSWYSGSDPEGVRGVGRWDGTEWTQLGDGLFNRGIAVTVHNGELIAGTNYLSTWNGSAWVRLPETGIGALTESDVPKQVAINTLLSRGDLLVGGSFTLVATERPPGLGRVASFFARWGCVSCPADMTGDGVVDFADYLEFLNLFDAQDPRADLNGDGIVDFADYLEFLNAFSSGCA